MYSCFRPGKTWYDTDGKPIQAHGGSILFANDTFYWYGENKEGITGRATGTACLLLASRGKIIFFERSI